MRITRGALSIAACLVLAGSGLRGDERAFSTDEIVVPGAIAASAQGINAAGDVVGVFVDSAHHSHGFVLQGGTVTSIDYPGAATTEARGIGPGGDIVGDYVMPGEPAVNAHGFLLTRQGEFLPVHYPGHINEILQRVLPDGTILGCRHDTDLMGTMRGIVISAGGGSEIDTVASMNNGATPDGSVIVGFFTNMLAMPAQQQGYVIENGQLTPFLVPGSNATSAWDVNPRGEIVGAYRDTATKHFHGYVREGDVYQTIDVPGATATRAFGINAGGDVVGAYVDSASMSHAFIASRTRGHNQ